MTDPETPTPSAAVARLREAARECRRATETCIAEADSARLPLISISYRDKADLFTLAALACEEAAARREYEASRRAAVIGAPLTVWGKSSEAREALANAEGDLDAALAPARGAGEAT